jgi:hypothetical protein
MNQRAMPDGGGIVAGRDAARRRPEARAGRRNPARDHLQGSVSANAVNSSVDARSRSR